LGGRQTRIKVEGLFDRHDTLDEIEAVLSRTGICRLGHL